MKFPSRWHNPNLVLGVAILLTFVLIAIIGPHLSRYGAGEILDVVDVPPNTDHPMGVTTHGQDLFVQWAYGARFSLVISFGGAALSTVISVLIGATAGYAGRWIDALLSLLTNAVLTVPPLPLLMVLALGVSFTSPTRLVILLGITTWAYGARMVRGETRGLRERDFVLAARVTGESRVALVVHEILPHLLSIVRFVFVNAVLLVLVIEFSLEFLGIPTGDNPVFRGWGALLGEAHYDQAFLAGTWWYWLFPALGIMLTVMAVALINSGLDPLLDPRIATRATIPLRSRFRLPWFPAIRGRGQAPQAPPQSPATH